MNATMEKHYIDFEERFGYGPCGAVAALLRQRGICSVAVCVYSTPNDELGFGHFIGVDADGGIVDLVNPFLGEGEYKEMELLPKDEMPDLVDDEAVAFWSERI